MTVKLSGAEIDSMYRAIEQVGDIETDAIIICEAKQLRDDIIVSQLVSQAQAALSMDTIRMTYDKVTPVAVKVVGGSQIQIVEFEEVTREGIEARRSLVVRSNARYRLKPSVVGIQAT